MECLYFCRIQVDPLCRLTSLRSGFFYDRLMPMRLREFLADEFSMMRNEADNIALTLSLGSVGLFIAVLVAIVIQSWVPIIALLAVYVLLLCIFFLAALVFLVVYWFLEERS